MTSRRRRVREELSCAPRRKTPLGSASGRLPQPLGDEAESARVGHHNGDYGESKDHHIPTAGRAKIGIRHGVDRLVEDRANDRAYEKSGSTDHRDQRNLDRGRKDGEKVRVGEANKEYRSEERRVG